jgi:hypothetical protein
LKWFSVSLPYSSGEEEGNFLVQKISTFLPSRKGRGVGVGTLWDRHGSGNFKAVLWIRIGFRRIRIQHFRAMRIRIQGFVYQKLQNFAEEIKSNFYIYQKILKEGPALQNIKLFNFLLFLWVNFALLDPDPDPADDKCS